MSYKMKGFGGFKESPMKIDVDKAESTGPEKVEVETKGPDLEKKEAPKDKTKAKGDGVKGAAAANAITGIMGLASQAMEEAPRQHKTTNPASMMKKVGG